MNVKRKLLAIKVAYLVGVVLQFIFAWIRFYLRYSESKVRVHRDWGVLVDILLWGLYIPWPVFGTIYLPMQIFAITREIRNDLYWYKHWFGRIFGMFLSSQFLFQNAVLGSVIGYNYFQIIPPDRCVEAYFQIVIDILDGLVGNIVLFFFVIILFRPLLPKMCCSGMDAHVTNDEGYVTVTPAYPLTSDGEVRVVERKQDDEDVNCCNKRVALGFALLFHLIYFGGYVCMLVFLSYRIYCAQTGFQYCYNLYA